MRYALVLMLVSVLGFSQSKKQLTKEIKQFQKELNEEYLDAKKSPLRGDNFTNFKEHPFFPINLKYRVVATLDKNVNSEVIDFQTSSGKIKRFREFAKANFQIDSKDYSLMIYQNTDLAKQSGYEDYLFLPFHDETNTKETYGGGKYIDLRIPKGETIVIDFNQSYQPFCAYNAFDYSCPIVPQSNTLPIEINAGVMYKGDYYH